MAKGYYWDGPEGAHRSYCDAVHELSEKFFSERKLVPDTMTPDDARDVLKEIRASNDPRIRDFNRTMRMLHGSSGLDNQALGGSDEIFLHGRVWRHLHDKASEVLDGFGKKDCFGRADYWIVDDDWGFDFIRVEVQNLQLMRPAVIGRLQQLLADFPEWQIAVRVDVPGKEESWPLMGLLVRHDRVIDHLKRDVLPEEYRSLSYDSEQS
jgi:hypothetical protein